MRYKTLRRMIGLKDESGHYAAATVAEGRIFEVVGRAEDQRFVVIAVEPEGELLQIFESDLKDRCTTRLGRRPRPKSSAAG